MSEFTGSVALARLVLRRDRGRLAIWVVVLTAVTIASAVSLLGVYPDQASIDAYGALFGDNPALVVFAGPGYGLDDPTIGAILVNETQLWGMIAVAFMSIFLVVRNTRAEEDDERADLVLSTPVGRHALAVAAVIVVSSVELVVAGLCIAGLSSMGYPVVGSVALAASWLAVGLVFVAVATLVSQLMGSGRGAIVLSSTVLLVAFTIRAVGDVTGNWLTWLSPIGWGQSVRAYAGERWWTLALCLAAVLVTLATSMGLADRRDLGSGLVPERVGATGLAPWASTSVGFAWRQQRGALAAWVVSLVVVGLVYGSVTDDIDALLLDNPQLADLLANLEGASLTDAFLSTAVMMMSIMATGWSVASVLAAHRDETQGRLDLVLVQPVERRRWLAGAAAVAAVGSVVVVTAAGLGLGLAAAVTLGDAGEVARCVAASMATLPAVAAVLGATVLVVGVLPGAANATWGLVGLVAIIGYLGDALDLPSSVRSVSPFEVLARTPAEPLSVDAVAGVTAAAVLLVAGGLWAFDRRDVAA